MNFTIAVTKNQVLIELHSSPKLTNVFVQTHVCLSKFKQPQQWTQTFFNFNSKILLLQLKINTDGSSTLNWVIISSHSMVIKQFNPPISSEPLHMIKDKKSNLIIFRRSKLSFNIVSKTLKTGCESPLLLQPCLRENQFLVLSWH